MLPRVRSALQRRAVQMSVEGASKRFGGVVAVDGVSVDIPKGRILSIIGPNGAGKTSLLNMISGFYRPDSGRITLDGRDITGKRPSAVAALGVARTFQNIALFGGLTVLDNLMLGRHVLMRAGVLSSVLYWGLAQREEIRHRAACEEIIEFLKLQDLRKQPTAALPYGLRKRVELGRALAQEPKILLLDEPMGGMNQDEKEDMARYVLDVNQERGITVVLIEHDMGVVMDISDNVVVLDRGRKIAAGAPADVQSNPAVIAGLSRHRQGRPAVTLAAESATDTLPKLLRRNAKSIGVLPGMREKDRGIWQTHSWRACQDHVRDFALGLAAHGFKRGDKLSVLGDNRARLYWAQIATQALGGMSVPLYQDSIASELRARAVPRRGVGGGGRGPGAGRQGAVVAGRAAEPAARRLRGPARHELPIARTFSNRSRTSRLRAAPSARSIPAITSANSTGAGPRTWR